MYFVMRPDNANDPAATFTRVGRPTKNLVAAVKLATAHHGRIYEMGHDCNGMCSRCVGDYFDPKPVTFRPSREYHQSRAVAAIFGVTSGQAA